MASVKIPKAFLRLIPLRSLRVAVGTSTIDTSEVIAAKNTNKKNENATADAPKKPISFCSANKILGKYTNIIDTDESESAAGSVLGSKLNIAGNTIKPATNATNESVIATILALPTMSSFLDM